jgi:hypothetical protein
LILIQACVSHLLDTPSCPLSGPTFWDPSSLILSLATSFFGRLLTQTRVCLAFDRLSFRNYTNTFLFMCGSNSKHSVISSSFHTCISFILSPLPYIITYMSWLSTSYGCPSFIVLVWSYHWQYKYPFTSMPLWEWMHNKPQYTLRYCHNYCFGEWNTCSKGGVPPFPSPHPTMNEYLYQQKQLSNLDECHHCLFNSHKYGVIASMTTTHVVMKVALKKTRSYDEWTVGDDFIPLVIKTYGCFHSCFNSFFTTCAHTTIMCHQRSSLVPSMFFSYYKQHVPYPTVCISHNNSSVGYYIWLGFLISSVHHN